MEKIIEINIKDENILFDKYNNKKISTDFINYLIENMPKLEVNEHIDIIFDNKLKNKEIPILIKDKLKEEYNKTIIKHNRNSFVQFLYFLIGIFVIFISTLIEGTVFKEIVLIGGWVFIWALVESEIFLDIDNKKRQKKLMSLINSEILEK